MLEVKFKQYVNGVMEETADHGNVEQLFRRFQMQPEGPDEGKLSDINEESGCDKKTKMSQRK